MLGRQGGRRTPRALRRGSATSTSRAASLTIPAAGSLIPFTSNSPPVIPANSVGTGAFIFFPEIVAPFLPEIPDQWRDNARDLSLRSGSTTRNHLFLSLPPRENRGRQDRLFVGACGRATPWPRR